MRHAVVDLAASKVVNVVEIEPEDGSEVHPGTLYVRSDSANIGDGWNGVAIVPQPNSDSRLAEKRGV